MAFSVIEFSLLVHKHPEQAHAKLVELFVLSKGAYEPIAAEFGVDRVTVYRWCKRLVAAGYEDPRMGQRGPVGRPRTTPKRRMKAAS